jgi:hypothetical protein
MNPQIKELLEQVAKESYNLAGQIQIKANDVECYKLSVIFFYM